MPADALLQLADVMLMQHTNTATDDARIDASRIVACS